MLIIYCVFALDAISFACHLSIQTKHVLLLGGSFFGIGLLGSVTALLSIIWRPIAGHLSDQKNKQDVIVGCMLLSLLGNVLGWTASSMWMYTIAKVICVANTAVQTLLKTTVTDLAKSDEESSKVFNKLGALSAIAFLIGIVLGSTVADSPRGIDYVHLLSISNIVVCIGLIKTLPRVASKKTKPAEKDDALPQTPLQQVTSIYENLKKLVTSPRYWDIFTIKLLLDYGFFMYYNTSGLTLRTDYSMSDKYIGFLITGIMVFSVGSNLVISKVKARFYPTDPGYLKIWHFTLVQALAYVTLASTSSLPVFIMAMVANACSKTFIDSSLNDLLFTKTEASEKGVVMSSFDNILSVGQVLGPVTAGTASEVFGVRSAFLLSGAFIVVANQIANSKRTR